MERTGTQLCLCRIALLAVVVVAISGCHQAHWAAADQDDLPSPNVPGRPRSLVFDAQDVAAGSMAGTQLAEQVDVIPWYAYRNDVRVTTNAGVQGSVLENTVTYSTDRQTVIGGLPFDQYTSSNYRVRIQQSVR